MPKKDYTYKTVGGNCAAEVTVWWHARSQDMARPIGV